MKIPSYETKFNVEDVVWLMYNNKPTMGIVYEVHFEMTEEADLSWTEICHNIVSRIKSYFDRHSLERNVWYRVQKLNDDGSYYGVGMFNHVTSDSMFHTKEELLKSFL